MMLPVRAKTKVRYAVLFLVLCVLCLILLKPGISPSSNTLRNILFKEKNDVIADEYKRRSPQGETKVELIYTKIIENKTKKLGANITNHNTKANRNGHRKGVNDFNYEEMTKDNATNHISDLQDTNITLFDPSESIITYYIDDKDHLFEKSQINRSRMESGYWAKDFPLTPEEALLQYGHLLPSWEQREIRNYPKVYYLGLGAKKVQITQNVSTNFGFDYTSQLFDISGKYKMVAGDHIGYRYEIIKYVGFGGFAGVAVARDWSNPKRRNVAIKIMHIPGNRKIYMREIKMMKYIQNFASNLDYFSRMIASFKFRNHVCMVLDLLGPGLDSDDALGSFIGNMSVLHQYAEDIFHGLFYLQEINVIQGDLTPDNIMTVYGKDNRSEGQLLKIADFGVGCVFRNDDYHCDSSFLQALHHRSPEVFLDSQITPQIDMFSVGVILAKFYFGLVPFFGVEERGHFASMMEVLGLPPANMIAESPKKKFYTESVCVANKTAPLYRMPLTKFRKTFDTTLLDLIARCLEYDPKLRITPAEALRHPFITGLPPPTAFPEPMFMRRLKSEDERKLSTMKMRDVCKSLTRSENNRREQKDN